MPVTLNISLTQKMRDFIDLRVQDGDYASASDYIRCLLRADSEQRLDQMLVDGLKGPFVELNESEWEKTAQEIISKIASDQEDAA